MTKHTPGPWHIANSFSRTEFGRYRLAIYPNSDMQHPHVSVSAPDDDAMTEVTANARLIAAAPDMLAALQNLLNYTGGWDLKDPEHPIVAARAAIAKAEGRTP